MSPDNVYQHSATYKLANAPIPELLKYYALPAVVATMVNSLYSIVDRIFIGQGVDSLALSGLTVTFPILLFLQAFGILIGAGASSRISILLGQKEHQRAENLLGNAFVLSLTLSTTTIALSLIFLDPLLRSFGASSATLPYAKEYLEIALPGNIFANICYTYNSVMRSSGYPTKAMKTMLIGAVLNTILDPLFIFGFGMGIKGAALATVISMFVGMCYVLRHFLSKDSLLKLKPKYFKLKREHIAAIITIGLAPFMVQLTGSAVSVFFNKSLYTYGGDYAIGAYGIQNSYGMLVVMLMFGVSQGMQPIVGFNYGAGNIDRMREAFSLSTRANILIGFVGFLLAMIAPSIIARIFTSDPEMIEISAKALRMVMWALWAVGLQVSATQFFQSIGNVRKSIFLSLTRQVIFLLPLLYFLPPYLGLNGIWLTMPISDVCAATISGVWAHNFLKRQRPAQ